VIAIGIATLFLSTSTYWWDELYPTLTRPRLAVFIHAIPWWYWVIAGLVVILVLVVEESLKTINRSEAELEEYKTKAAHRPNIAIVIHSISVARPTSDNPTMAYILTVLSVRNTGAPSVVDNWKLKLEDYPNSEAKRVTVVSDLVWQYKDNSYTFSPNDHIQRKVTEEPVPSGGKRVGFLLWSAPGAVSSVKPAAFPKITITARDVTGTLITATNKATRQNEEGSYYYGLDAATLNP